MSDWIGKVLDILSVIPLFKLGKLKKVKGILDTARKASKAAADARKVADAAKGAAKAADATVGKAAAASSAANKAMREAVEEAEKAAAEAAQKALNGSGSLEDAYKAADKAKEARKKADEVRKKTEERIKKAEEEAAEAQKKATEAEGEAKAREAHSLEIWEIIKEIGLPMDLIRCLSRLLGMVLLVRVEPGKDASLGGVLLASDGSPMDDCFVLLMRSGTVVAATMTDYGGGFAFDNLASGEHQVLVDLDPPYLERVQVHPGSQTLLLHPFGGPCRNVIVVESGEALPAAFVLVVRTDRNRVIGAVLAETNHQGIACIPTSSMDERHVVLVYVETERGFTLLPPRVRGTEDCEELRFVVPPGGATGRVFGADSKIPLANIPVELLPLRKGAFPSVLQDWASARAYTDSEGRWTAKGLPAGEYRLVAAQPGSPAATLDVVISNSIAQVDDLSLRIVANPGSIKGEIRTPEGASGGYVAMIDGQGRPTGRRVAVPSHGRFEILGVPAGEYKLEVQGESPADVVVIPVAVGEGRCTHLVVELTPPCKGDKGHGSMG